MLIDWGEEGQPQQFLVRATFFSLFLFARIGHLKKIYLKDEDFGVARTRKWGECGSDYEFLWLAFRPSLISLAIYILQIRTKTFD